MDFASFSAILKLWTLQDVYEGGDEEFLDQPSSIKKLFYFRIDMWTSIFHGSWSGKKNSVALLSYVYVHMYAVKVITSNLVLMRTKVANVLSLKLQTRISELELDSLQLAISLVEVDWSVFKETVYTTAL